MTYTLKNLKERMKHQIIEELKAYILMTNKMQTLVNETVDRVFKDFERELRRRLINIDKLPNPEEIITTTKRKFAEDFNQEIREIWGVE